MSITYPNGCKKAFTLSYDDGVEQDKRLIKIFDKYSLKATFNIGFGLLDQNSHWETKNVNHKFTTNKDPEREKSNTIVKRLKSTEIKEVYKNHEIACHGLNHPHIPNVSSEQKVIEIVKDKEELEKILQKPMEGMAYPFGEVDDEMIEIMKNCGLKYGRVVPSTENFELPTDFFRINPTAHHNNENIFSLINEYKNLDEDKLSVFYLWGHSYEFDVNDNWEHIEKVCQEISGQSDIWYCTNEELINFLSTL